MTTDTPPRPDEAVARLKMLPGIIEQSPYWADTRRACPDLAADLRLVLSALASRAEEIAALRDALEDVANPMRVLQRKADADGGRLSGMAHSIANNLDFVQRIARAALNPSHETEKGS